MAPINFVTLVRVKFLNGQTESDWGTFPIAINPNLYELPHEITVYLENNDQNHHQTTISINKFFFTSIKNEVTGETVPNLMFRKRNSNHMTKMLEVEERDWDNNSLRLNSINIYYPLTLNYRGLRRFSTNNASYSSGTGRSNSTLEDDVHGRPKCDICFKFNNSINGSDETMPFHLCPNDVVVRDFRTTAGPIAPPSKLRHRH